MTASFVVFAYNNLLTPLVPVELTDEDPDAPAELSLADFRSVKASSTTDTEVSFTATVGASSEFNCAAVHGDNLTDDGEIEVLGSNDNFASSTVIVPSQPRTGDIWFQRFDAQAFTKVRFTFRDPTNPAGFICVGKMFLGTAWQSDANYDWGGIQRGMVDLSSRSRSLNGIDHYSRKPKPRTQTMSFTRVAPDEQASMIAMRDAVGISEQFIIAVDPDNEPDLVFLARFTQMPEPGYVDAFQYDYSIQTMEVV